MIRTGWLYSLSFPDLTLASKAVPGPERKLEAPADFRFNEDRCSLISLVRVFVENGGVVFLWALTAFHHDGQKRAKLRDGVP